MADGFSLNTTGLKVTGKPTRREWEAFGRDLKRQHFAVQFAIGDWANYGVEIFGLDGAEIAAQVGVTQGTLLVYCGVAKRVSAGVRNARLSFTHHKAVAQLTTEEQDKWLTRAEQHGWTAETLDNKVRGRDSRVAVPTPYAILADCKDEAIFDKVTAFLDEIKVEWERATSKAYRGRSAA